MTLLNRMTNRTHLFAGTLPVLVLIISITGNPTSATFLLLKLAKLACKHQNTPFPIITLSTSNGGLTTARPNTTTTFSTPPPPTFSGLVGGFVPTNINELTFPPFPPGLTAVTDNLLPVINVRTRNFDDSGSGNAGALLHRIGSVKPVTQRPKTSIEQNLEVLMKLG